MSLLSFGIVAVPFEEVAQKARCITSTGSASQKYVLSDRINASKLVRVLYKRSLTIHNSASELMDIKLLYLVKGAIYILYR